MSTIRVSGKRVENMTQTAENLWKTSAPGITTRIRVLPEFSTPEAHERRIAARKAAKGAEFTAGCAIHGLTIFDTATGACLSCVAGKIAAGLPVRIAYGGSYGDCYPLPCPVHGDDALAHYQGNRCAACYDTYGRKRKGRPGHAERVEARRTGATSYRATCPVHGETDFHTVRGKCLDCFNSLGYPRRVPR